MDYLEKARRVISLEMGEVQRLLARLDGSFEEAVETIRRCVENRGKVVVVGVGKSGHIGEKIAATLTSTGSPAVVLNSLNALHGDLGVVADGDVRVPIGRANIVRSGDAVTIVAMSYLVAEAAHACRALEAARISCELVDLRTIKPIDYDTITTSLRKTGRMIVLDTGATTGSVAGEIIARMVMSEWTHFRSPPRRLASPDCPEPTSYGLSKGFYITARDIIAQVCEMMGVADLPLQHLPPEREHHDVPGEWFTGPF